MLNQQEKYTHISNNFFSQDHYIELSTAMYESNKNETLNWPKWMESIGRIMICMKTKGNTSEMKRIK